VIDNPIMLWIFEYSILPKGCNLKQNSSDTGDECHYNIRNLSDREARKIIVGQDLSAFSVCKNTKIVPFY
jgi:hypothetical protein